MCFFHFLWSFLDRYSPNPCAFLVRLERGSALHVKLMVSKIKSMMCLMYCMHFAIVLS